MPWPLPHLLMWLQICSELNVGKFCISLSSPQYSVKKKRKVWKIIGGVLLAIVATVLAVIFAVLLILYGIPLALICGGAVIALLSCTLWATPANALVTLGNGLAAFAAGILLGLLSIKLSILFVPPVFRAFVAVLRAPFNWIRNRCRRTGGGNV